MSPTGAGLCTGMKPVLRNLFLTLLAGSALAGDVPKSYSTRDPCPVTCDTAAGGAWSVYTNVKRVEACDKHMLLDFALHNPLDDPSTTVKIRACTLPDEVPSVSRRLVDRDTDADSDLCVAGASSIDVSLDVASSGNGSYFTYATANALAQVSSYLSASCDLSQVFSYSTGSIVGVFVGAAIDNGGSTTAVLAELIDMVNNTDTVTPEIMFAQRCVSEGSSKHTFGVAINNAADLSWVQSSVQSWSNGLCLNASSLTSAETSQIANTTIYEYTHPAVTLSNITVIHPNSTATTSGTITASLTSSATGSSGTADLGTSTSTGLSSDAETSSGTLLSTASTSESTGTSTAAAVTPPGPTQTGIVSTCNAYAIPTSGQGCWDFANDNGITTDELYEWNPAIGDCENFWADEAYCVGVSSSEKRDHVITARNPLRYQWKRDECDTTQIYSGDTCTSLTAECGVSLDDFESYNDGLCDDPLSPGQHVCCSEGDLPDYTPQMYDNGTCYTYVVNTGDTCSDIGAAVGLTITEIEEFNNGTTWGWNGCGDLLADAKICLSEGDPPLPNAVANAECGPTVPGTEMPTDGTALADLNPCPLNACCDIWGQCGITPQYCTNTTGPSGNPGTAPSDENGCISNCGTDIVNNSHNFTDKIYVGYYETWNWDRECLNMRAASIDTTQYTHIHWAFATISDDFEVVINDTYNQWEDFKALPVKRIVSIGGWGYSTDASTYDKMRTAISPDNRKTFAKNIITFLEDEDIDGVDFDWEYPGATDIPGIPAGEDTDGYYYFQFISIVRGYLGLDTDKTISMAAPASYWYLKNFEIYKSALECDYVVYMTYDLHGQWDYLNSWSQDGCETGNCLRSHVNLTETYYALSMITKAGVPSYLITVGVSSYGRSFKMAEAGCTGPECFYLANSDNSSMAAEGMCTVTAGYIANAEIKNIIYSNSTNVDSWYDEETDTDYLVYNDTEWVAYMSQDVKTSRTQLWNSYNFRGTVDWAVDLMEFTSDDGDPDGTCESGEYDDDDECVVYDEYANVDEWTPCTDGPFDFDDLDDDTINSWPSWCVAQYTIESLKNLFNDKLSDFTDMVNGDYDDKFDTYAEAVADSASSQVHDFMMDNGNDYFTCNIMEMSTCCSFCDDCNYCFGNENCYNVVSILQGLHTIEQKTLIVHWENKSEPCPPDLSERGYGTHQSIWWHLTEDKSAAFYEDLLNATGIPQAKIGMGRYTDVDSCEGTSHKEGDGAECWNQGYEFNVPVPQGYTEDDVTNPKDTVQSGLDAASDLPDQIDSILTQLKVLTYLGDPYELIDAISLPILMIASGVESMQEVIKTADKIEEAERKAIILAFISALLLFIPIVGEVASAVAGAADVAAVIAILGTVGNAAFDIYTIVDDKDNAPLAIVDLILAPLALADVAIVAKAATIRRGMDVADIAKLGERVESRMSKLQSVTGVCHA
ncbi:hypothetical protein PFICI_04568 [Pestalotiopsis fici W106-1]|uniref:chitinase n=1 Tax=Pestalotiopsis fici (strain W106-1 / CGMCC3.15140) TaxID=1229662 RepID=W3XB66_PESFW|nr:uncharacterized protein PFICI_04568 [Pestalotiopsis fici W106-1]ETS82692.1 hypothetical protein PFICI_04568 [Pestalotiopsis fici W106-1]